MAASGPVTPRPGPDPDAAPDALLAFRANVVAVAAAVLAIGVVALAIVLPLTTSTATVLDSIILAGAATVHLGVAVTVGRRWLPGGTFNVLYVAILVLLHGAGLSTSVTPGGDAFWFVLIPLGVSALTLSLPVHLLATAACLLTGVVGTVVGPGLDGSFLAPRSVAILLFSGVMAALARRLEQALVEADLAAAALRDRYRELEAANVRLAELDRAKDDFVSTVAHELRSPLTAVVGSSDTLARAWEQLADGDRRNLVDVIGRNARGLQGIVLALLDVARIERGGFEPRHDLVDLGALASESVLRLETALERHDVRLELADGSTVRSDPLLLERVLDNLLANAARHTPVGTVVRIRSVAVDGEVRMEVEDEGPGIAPDVVERLGERFFHPGTGQGGDPDSIGIGLALVGDVLRALGSRLEIRSAPGQGTSFAFALPAA